ncbi:unnamed protein product [Rhizoctonia solani]|uniref:Uncharacterized protein n=1 Tax=Rhizoctonia solani TaxID=456999 RepID=A0A8H3HT79_9AGAM|nr:unnamed protein product [Rhizoctonia solani]
MQDDPVYYVQRTVQITPKSPSEVLPQEQTLCSWLRSFGDIWHFRPFCIEENGAVVSSYSPNTAIVVFHSPVAARYTLDSSRNETNVSFWRTKLLRAQTLGKTGNLYQAFLVEIVPKLRQELKDQHPGLSGPSHFPKTQLRTSGLDDYEPPLKRPRIEDSETTPDGGNGTSNQVSTSKSFETPSTIPNTIEWAYARIAQLEAELDTTKAARDMAVSEQEVIRTAHQTERRARREAMTQKSAAEAALSRREIGQDRLLSDLEAALAQKSALSTDLDGLRKRFAAAEDKLRLVQSSFDEIENCHGRIKSLELELGTAQDLVHKLQLQNSQLEQHKTNPDTTELDGARARIKELKSKTKQSKTNLNSTQEQLVSTQKSLESMERKYSSARRRYESAKSKLGTYKGRLEDERILTKKLRDTLTPAAYQSLGAMHETLGALLSAMGHPSARERGEIRPKEESD